MIDGDALRTVQAPLKARYREHPDAAVVTLRASGNIGLEDVTCSVRTSKALIEAGLHPATGGDGMAACSGDMLLEALVACAGVTLNAVASALGIELRSGEVTGRWRSRLSRHPWCRPGGAGWFQGHPSGLRTRYRCR